MTEHVSELLPWFINGRLQALDQARVAEHLAHCKHCREELSLQQHLCAAISSPNKIELAPQPAFNKLWEKIVAEENSISTVRVHQHGRFSLFAAIHAGVNWISTRWMPIALTAQALAIVALISVVAVITRHNANTNDVYRTVTSSATADVTTIQVVFDDATRLVDIKEVLIKSNLQVAAGPTAAGVYSLTPSNRHTDFNAQEVVRSLRDDPRVRFAELLHH